MSVCGEKGEGGMQQVNAFLFTSKTCKNVHVSRIESESEIGVSQWY